MQKSMAVFNAIELHSKKMIKMVNLRLGIVYHNFLRREKTLLLKTLLQQDMD